MNFQKQKIATSALVVSLLGTAATFSAQGFIGSLLHHGFLASLIGGLADWYAVVALFRKPLGISYRSEILKRNKERIMDEIVKFVANDILSGENIMRVLGKENMAKLLVAYLNERGGRDRVTVAVIEVLDAWLKATDTKKIAKKLAPTVKEGLFVFFEKENAEKLLDIFAKNELSALTLLTDIAEGIFKLEETQKMLKSNIKEALTEYSKDSFGRSMMIEMLDLNEDTIFSEIETAFLNKTSEIKSGEGDTYENLKLKIPALVSEIKSSEMFSEKIINIREYIEDNLFVEDVIDKILKSQTADKKIKGTVEKFLHNKFDEFVRNEEMQLKFDEWIKKFISERIVQNHDILASIAKERLDEFTEEEFAGFVEEKVNDDLQMIRVNGAIVGGAVGMFLYAIIYMAERAF